MVNSSIILICVGIAVHPLQMRSLWAGNYDVSNAARIFVPAKAAVIMFPEIVWKLRRLAWAKSRPILKEPIFAAGFR